MESEIAIGSGILLLIYGVLMALFMVPMIIAVKRNHSNKTAIILVNIFLGATIIGWFVALFWAMSKKKTDAMAIPQ